MVHGEHRIPYWIDRRLTGLAGPEFDGAISLGLLSEPEDSQYGKYRLIYGPAKVVVVTGKNDCRCSGGISLYQFV